MTSSTSTVRRLAEITDAAAFERVAAAVLRAAKPTVYENMAHPGVQPGGKTIKAPFDNVGWLTSSDGQQRLVCVAHTTDQRDLAGKWLHDPATARARKPGGKPTKPAGDLIKGIAEIGVLRKTIPDLAVTFALTSNTEVSLAIRAAAERLAASARVELDIWSVSRISHFLDTDPIGQLIRRQHLGTQVELLSRNLLLEMSERSIRDHFSEEVLQESIHRDDFVLGHSDTLVVGNSGMGKTTACAVALLMRVLSGTPALVIRTEFIDAAPTFEMALESELKRLQPALEERGGERAISLCSEEDPLLVLFEDINRSTSPGILLNKVLSWAQPAVATGKSAGRRWRAVCPVWPRHLDAIEDQKRSLAEVTILRVDKYSQAEAIRAVTKRAEALGLAIDVGRAIEIASKLGCDPLLIGLHNLQSAEPATDVIRAYIDERFGIIAAEGQLTRSDVQEAVRKLILEALERRRLTPTWSEARSWIGDKDVVRLVRSVLLEGSVIRLARSVAEETLEFRHDRVMNNLLSSSLTEALRRPSRPSYIVDPFFAEPVAGAVVLERLPPPELLTLMDSSPAVAAHALKICSEQQNSYADILVQVISAWLQEPGISETDMVGRRFAVAKVLSEISHPKVRSLVAQFPEDDRSWWDSLWSAQFRNGDLRAGFALLSRHRLGTTIAGRQSLLSLVKQAYGASLVAAVGETLRRTDLDEPPQHAMRSGALRLAGYLGTSELGPSVRVCWGQDASADRDLRSYLFAAARCCGDLPEAVLGPVLDAWESLPDDPDPVHGRPAERLAAEGVDWEFRRYVPADALRYFVERANSSDKLRWPIGYMLGDIDHPIALEHVVRYAATLGFISAHSLQRGWRRRSDDSGVQMSRESRRHLLKISLDESESDEVRKQAFAFWDCSLDADDLPAIRHITETSPLFHRAIWARARRGDHSVIPVVLPKVSEDPTRWLRIGRHVWSDDMTGALELAIDVLCAESSEVPSDLQYAVADGLMNVELHRRVQMLKSRWDRLREKPLIVQVALLSTGPDAAELVRQAFSSSESPNRLLRHFASNVGMFEDGNRKLSSPGQLLNLVPYLSHFPDDDVILLWDACTERGWIDFQEQHLAGRLREVPNHSLRLSDDPVDLNDLEEALNPKTGERVYLRYWLERPMRRGIPRARQFDALLQWLGAHEQEKALQIAAAILSREGTRAELSLFEAAASGRPNSAGLMESVRFDVFNRSLV